MFPQNTYFLCGSVPEPKGKWVKEESVGRGSKSLYMSENQGPSCLGLSPVCHQHLDDEIGKKNQEGAGCIVFEGGECRESVLEGKGSVGVSVEIGATRAAHHLGGVSSRQERVSQPPHPPSSSGPGRLYWFSKELPSSLPSPPSNSVYRVTAVWREIQAPHPQDHKLSRPGR